MKNKKYGNIGEPIYTLSDEPEKSGLLKAIGTIIGVGAVLTTFYLGGKNVYEQYNEAPKMVKNAKGIENPIGTGLLWGAYAKEKEINGFVHNSETWNAYIERTKELNNGSLNKIEYTPDANNNGKSD
ncbi:MAG: hypothetical protein Q8Q04_00940 [archaeon]|nr:hypothetical protein [archaeon]